MREFQIHSTLRSCVAALVFMLLPVTAAAEVFTVSDIRLQGLQRVSAGTVFNILPVNVGDQLDETSVRQLMRILFRSGYFNDIRMSCRTEVSSS